MAQPSFLLQNIESNHWYRPKWIFAWKIVSVWYHLHASRSASCLLRIVSLRFASKSHVQWEDLYLSFVRVTGITYELWQSSQVSRTLHKITSSVVNLGRMRYFRVPCLLTYDCHPSHLQAPHRSPIVLQHVGEACPALKDCIETGYVGFHISDFPNMNT